MLVKEVRNGPPKTVSKLRFICRRRLRDRVMFNRLKLRPVLLSVGFSANILLVLIPLAKILICSSFLNRLLSSIHHLIAKGLYIYLQMTIWSLRAAKLTKHFALFHSVIVGLTRKLEIQPGVFNFRFLSFREVGTCA